MNELTQALKVLVTRYPGTMAELARQAAVDRSSLYKFCNGQRVPSLDQLERLADALELTGEQRTTLLLQYKQRSRSTDPHLRAELHRLLAAAFLVEEYTQGTSSLSNQQAQALPCPTYVEASAPSAMRWLRCWPAICSPATPARCCSHPFPMRCSTGCSSTAFPVRRASRCRSASCCFSPPIPGFRGSASAILPT